MQQQQTTRLGVCNLCEAICGLVFTLEDRTGRITDVRGNPDDPLSRGHICPKAVGAAGRPRGPRPAAAPDEAGPTGSTDATWQEISWDEALDLVADTSPATVNEHGRDALAIYLGNPNVHSLGSMTHGTAMVKSFRTRNMYSATSVDQLPAQMLAYLMYGHQLLLPVPDLDRTGYFLVFGANPMASNGSLMTVPDFPARLRALKAARRPDGRGRPAADRDRQGGAASTTSSGPAPTRSCCSRCCTCCSPRASPLPRRTSTGSTPCARRSSRSPPSAPRRCRASPRTTYAGWHGSSRRRRRRRSTAGSGVSTQEFGLVATWAVQLLNLVTGNLDRPGGVMLTRPAVDAVGRGFIGRGHHDLWRSRVRDLPEFSGELPVATLADEILTPGDGQVQGAADRRGQPRLLDARRPAARRGDRRAGLRGGGRHLRQRDDPARRRDPAAHLGAGARPLRPGLPHAGGAQHRPVHPGPVRQAGGVDARLGDLPRDRAAHPAAAHVETVPHGAARQAVRMRVSPTRTIDLLLRSGQDRLSVKRLLLRPGRPGPARALPARSG